MRNLPETAKKKHNDKRAEMIKHIQTQQNLILDAIPQVSQNEENMRRLGEVANKCDSLASEIETHFQFDAAESPTPISSEQPEQDLTPYLEAYERIYLNMFEIVHKLDEMLLWDKSFFFWNCKDVFSQSTFGELVQMDFYFSAHDIRGLKCVTSLLVYECSSSIILSIILKAIPFDSIKLP